MARNALLVHQTARTPQTALETQQPGADAEILYQAGKHRHKQLLPEFH